MAPSVNTIDLCEPIRTWALNINLKTRLSKRPLRLENRLEKIFEFFEVINYLGKQV